MFPGEPVALAQLSIHHRRKPDASVIDEPPPAGHPGAQVVTDGAEDYPRAAGHVLGGMLAHPFDHGRRSAVAHGESLPGFAGAEEFAAGRSVEDRVPQEVRLAGIILWRSHDNPAACHAFADVIIGL